MSLFRVRRSAGRNIVARIATQNGIAPLRTAARFEGICCVPHGMSTNGIAVPSAATMATSSQ